MGWVWAWLGLDWIDLVVLDKWASYQSCYLARHVIKKNQLGLIFALEFPIPPSFGLYTHTPMGKNHLYGG